MTLAGSTPLPSDHPVVRWHRILETRDIASLASLLHDDAVFRSPVVHTPQSCRRLVSACLVLGRRLKRSDDLDLHCVLGSGEARLDSRARRSVTRRHPSVPRRVHLREGGDVGQVDGR